MKGTQAPSSLLMRWPLDNASIDIPVQSFLPVYLHFGTRNFIVNIQQLKSENPGPLLNRYHWDDAASMSIPLLVKYNPPATYPNGSRPNANRHGVPAFSLRGLPTLIQHCFRALHSSEDTCPLKPGLHTLCQERRAAADRAVGSNLAGLKTLLTD